MALHITFGPFGAIVARHPLFERLMRQVPQHADNFNHGTPEEPEFQDEASLILSGGYKDMLHLQATAKSTGGDGKAFVESIWRTIQESALETYVRALPHTADAKGLNAAPQFHSYLRCSVASEPGEVILSGTIPTVNTIAGFGCRSSV